MIQWLKNILGVAPVETKQEPLILENPIVKVTTDRPKKERTKKTTSKVEKIVDLDLMKKPELLAHAKNLGIKVNASMSKGEILGAIKNA